MFNLILGFISMKTILCVLIQKKLNCTSVVVANLACKLYSCITELLPPLRAIQSGSNLYNFLISSLNGTVSFMQMNYITIPVSQHLNLKMFCSSNITLKENCRIPNALSASPELLLTLASNPPCLLPAFLFHHLQMQP